MVEAMDQPDTPLDVLIVGAGISGLGMAAHLAAKCPDKRYAILERREQLGGTWDLFRYPGVRSDSDMYTLGYEFEPWREGNAIAEGDSILAYLRRTAATRSIDRHIRFGCHVLAADWNIGDAMWTLRLADHSTIRGRFLFIGTGYYDYDHPYDAQIKGLETFGGTVVHPQFWPQDLDYTGKRVAIIGSGTTAVTLLPAMAGRASHVTMLARTPGWFIAMPARDHLASLLRKVLPDDRVHNLVRRFNSVVQGWLFNLSRRAPGLVGGFLTRRLRKALGPAYDRETYTPPYEPWEQRLCMVPDGDFFEAVRGGAASVVKGEIERVDEAGIALKDGRRIDADILVTATGLAMVPMGKIAISIDGTPVDFSQRWFYRNCMFSNVPNFAALMGYLNSGWTLKVDLVADWLCRLFRHMDERRWQVVVPRLADDHGLIEDNPIDEYSSGYLQRARNIIPKSAAQAPWRLGMDYAADRREMRRALIEDGVLTFEHATSECALVGSPAPS